MADFDRIYTEYFSAVYKYVYSLCRNESVAEEITQESFYKALNHIDRFDGKCKLYVWICQIAKNTYFTYAKKHSRHMPEDEPEARGTFTPDFETELMDKETAWQIHKLLHELKEPYKEVFTLRVFGELPFSHIADLFGKTESWARLVFYRAKAELRRKYDEKSL